MVLSPIMFHPETGAPLTVLRSIHPVIKPAFVFITQSIILVNMRV